MNYVCCVGCGWVVVGSLDLGVSFSFGCLILIWGCEVN